MSSFVQFGSDEPSNLKVGIGKTYTFNFNDQNSFDNFNFLNYGSHEVEKSFPSITLSVSPFGPISFNYSTEHRLGSVDVSEDCLDCVNSQYEVFLSNDVITEYNIEKYIKNCGSSEFSTSNFNIKILNDYGNGYKNYLISYCCDLTLDADMSYCVVRWDLNISVDCANNSLGAIPAEGIVCSAPKMECIPLGSAFNSWHCASDSQKISYFAKGDFCYKGCSSDDVDSSLLFRPQVPTHLELLSILSVAPPPTPSPTPNPSSDLSSLVKSSTPIPLIDAINSIEPSPTGTIHIFSPTLNLNESFLDSISLVSQDMAGDKPHNHKYCNFLGHSKVLTKVNNEDLPDRVFYKETSDGYFYKRKTFVHKGNNEHSTDVSGGTVFLLAESDSEKQSSPKTMSRGGSSDIIFNFGDLSKSSTFISLINYGEPVPVPTPQPSQLVEDQSLFEKIYHLNSDEFFSDASSINSGTPLLNLNWSYWLYSLPEKIYGKQLWWEGLPQEHLPYFEIINNSSNLFYNTYAFPNGSLKSYFSHVNNNPQVETFSFINMSPGLISNYKDSYLDPVFNIENLVNCHEYPIKLKYHFNPKPSLISSEYQGFNFPIERVEELFFFPNSSTMHFGGKNYFNSNYAVDKTLGVTNPEHALIQGKGIRFY